MLKAIIIDDIDAVRTKNTALIRQYCPGVSIVAEADSVKAGVQAIRTWNPDLVFLDIEMRDGTGFDLLQQLQPVSFKVIFITGYQNYAIRAFRFSAVDFLLKPLDPEELAEAVAKASETVNKELLEIRFNILFSNLTAPKHAQKILLRNSDALLSTAISDILHCEAHKNYTTFYFLNGQQFVVSTHLKDYDNLLVPLGFYRSHQSHLVNMAHFSHYHKRDNSIVLKNGIKIPLATRKKEEFIALIEGLF